MKTIYSIFAACAMLLFFSCSAEDEFETESVAPIPVMADSLDVDKKAANAQDEYFHVQFDIQDAFGTQASELVQKIRQNRLVALGVYAKEAGGTQASIHTLGMNIADGDDGNKSGFDICLGGTSSADHIMLVYREKFKNNVYGDIEMMYDAGSSQSTATLQRINNADYYSFRFAPVSDPASTVRMTVVLGMDFVTVGNGFRDVYYSAEIDVRTITQTTMPEYYYERETKYPYGY